MRAKNNKPAVAGGTSWRKQSLGGKAFDVANILVLSIAALVTVIPIIYVVVASFTPPEILLKERFILIPKGFSLEAYRFVFSTKSVVRALLVSVGVTVAGTFFNIFMTILFAYPLAHTQLRGRKALMLMVTFTLMFNGGTIPTYIVVRTLRLLDSYASLILPTAISTFSLIIFRNYFQALPAELEESGKIDGASYPHILARIIIPLSLPLIATFVIMSGVGYWNSWFTAVLYLNKTTMWPIQVVLRQIINLANGMAAADMTETNIVIPQESVRMTTIVVATLPIMLIYPFLQKYFTRGMLLGSVKG